MCLGNLKQRDTNLKCRDGTHRSVSSQSVLGCYCPGHIVFMECDEKITPLIIMLLLCSSVRELVCNEPNLSFIVIFHFSIIYEKSTTGMGGGWWERTNGLLRSCFLNQSRRGSELAPRFQQAVST